MAGKVLTKEDFAGSGDPTKEDTSPKGTPTDIKDQVFDADQKFDQDGKPIGEPEGKETPAIEEPVESQSKPSEEGFKPKHKTWEETEKARLELERGFTEKSMKLSDYEKRLAKLEKPVEKQTPTIDDQIADMTDVALKEIEMLPWERDTSGKAVPSSKRDRDAAIIWGKLQRKIARLEVDDASKVSNSEHDTTRKLYDASQKEGIKTDAELRILGYEYSKTDGSKDVDDRIKDAVESTKGILSSIREGLVKDQQKDKKDKEALKVLGRGSAGKRDDSESKKVQPSTMSQQLAELNEKRRMTKDDLR